MTEFDYFDCHVHTSEVYLDCGCEPDDRTKRLLEEEKRDNDRYIRRQKFVDRLAELPFDRAKAEDYGSLIRIMEEMKISSADFWTLDEQPGAWGASNGDEWHWKLRTVRNNALHGKRMFKLWERG